jgi:putative transposase
LSFPASAGSDEKENEAMK